MCGSKDALVAKGYDVNYAWGMGVHSHDMGGAMLPEMMRWLLAGRASLGRSERHDLEPIVQNGKVRCAVRGSAARHESGRAHAEAEDGASPRAAPFQARSLLSAGPVQAM